MLQVTVTTAESSQGVSSSSNGTSSSAHPGQKQNLKDELSLYMAASLLQLRGDSPSTSPLQDSDGNVLCFNGEIFTGLDIPAGGNDGKALLAALQQAAVMPTAMPAATAAEAAAGGATVEAAADVVAVFSKLRGPWSLIYWQKQQQRLWFGRDVMGE